MAGEDWTPSVADVAAHIRARTKIAGGKEAGTFQDESTAGANDQTRPNATQAEVLIDNAVRSVLGKTKGVEPCTDELKDSAKNLAALRAAMAVEASYYPEQTRTDRSNFAQLRQMYTDDLDGFLEGLALECGSQGGGGDEGAPGQSPAHSFDDEPLIGRRTPTSW